MLTFITTRDIKRSKINKYIPRKKLAEKLRAAWPRLTSAKADKALKRVNKEIVDIKSSIILYLISKLKSTNLYYKSNIILIRKEEQKNVRNNKSKTIRKGTKLFRRFEKSLQNN